MTKILLLNDNEYYGLEGVEFPVMVKGEPWSHGGYDVPASELIRIGMDEDSFGGKTLYWPPSCVVKSQSN